MERSLKVALPAPPPPPEPMVPVFVTPQENDSTSISPGCLTSTDSPLMSPIFAKMSDAIWTPQQFVVRLTAGYGRSRGLETPIYWGVNGSVGGLKLRETVAIAHKGDAIGAKCELGLLRSLANMPTNRVMSGRPLPPNLNCP